MLRHPPAGWVELPGERGPIWVPEATVRAIVEEKRRAICALIERAHEAFGGDDATSGCVPDRIPFVDGDGA